ncbi:SDR family oxidoreductase [Allorhizocola rhizosphaerae]|uniref:SDR family oxidoreductase n=1 Tax=Allorhizocola rhizosphaerae TaxID=1872709 RepID=UPI000E3D6586|nr:NAD(P)H-binding protein [Allorhizocola rhizosphaerae]
MTRSKVVVVHGASGTQGAPVVRRLVAAGYDVLAATRRPGSVALPPGVRAVRVDLTDVTTLIDAYVGVDAVVVQLPLVFEAGLAVRQADAILTALTKAQVPRAVFNPGMAAVTQPIGVPFVDARVALHNNLGATVAPVSTYLENLSAPWSAPLVHTGELAYPLGEEVANPWVALEDVAAAIVEELSASQPRPLRVVSGPQALTGEQLASEISVALGRPVRWRTIDPAEYERMLAPHLGAGVAAGIAASYQSPSPSRLDPSVVTLGQTTARQWAATGLRRMHEPRAGK